MSRVYDLWEKLVGAVLDREVLRRLALRSSSNSSCSSFSDDSSRYSFAESFKFGTVVSSMRNHAESVQELMQTHTNKVHAQIYSELIKVVRVSENLPEIEAAPPRCSSGIETVRLLNDGIDKAKSLLQYCSETSVLYLALTGEAILSRCKKSRNLLERSLCQLQSMVPVLLAAKISGMIVDLRSVAFFLDPSEEEAGRVLRELIRSSAVDYTEEAALAALRTVSSRLHISSQEALQTEKRSIRKLLEKIGEKDSNKRKILIFFLNLLKKYGKVIAETQTDNAASEHGNHFPIPSPYLLTDDVELRADYRTNESHINTLSRPVTPEEFICPLSSRLMYDPVVIASGQTVDEGHFTCPKTNSSASLTNSMVGLNLPLDYSNVSSAKNQTLQKALRFLGKLFAKSSAKKK